MLTISWPALRVGSQTIGTILSSLHGLTGDGLPAGRLPGSCWPDGSWPGGPWDGTSVVSTLVWEEFVSRARYGSPVWVSWISRSASAWLTASVTSTAELVDDDAELDWELVWELVWPVAPAAPTDSTSTRGSSSRVCAAPEACCSCGRSQLG